MEEQTPNINVVHSVWRRLKKAKIRDLQPTKDVKGGRGVTGHLQAQHRHYRKQRRSLEINRSEGAIDCFRVSPSALDPSLRAVNDLLRVLDRGLVRRFVFLQDVDRLLRRGTGFCLVPKLRLNLRLFVVHEIGVRVLL